jgi:hypothetical protein
VVEGLTQTENKKIFTLQMQNVEVELRKFETEKRKKDLGTQK